MSGQTIDVPIEALLSPKAAKRAGQSARRRMEMIAPQKQNNALAAINAVLVLARSLAYEGSSSDVAEVLDVAEYLPKLMLETDDRTSAFREQLVGLAAKHPKFAIALERFDNA